VRAAASGSRSPAGLVAFVGPSLSAAEARRIAPGVALLPPAGQGDVWRALELRPRAIALVDGVFESRPSVWHHEIVDALDAGVAVFGGASMGALRAAELWRHGMVGVGEIFRAYRDGELTGDDEVALLHADAEHGFRALTLPLVTVRRAAADAARAGAIGARDARALVRAAERIFYQARLWPAVLEGARLAPAARARWERFAAAGLADPKAEDARACLAAAARYARSRPAPPPLPWPPRTRPAHVRHRRLAATGALERLAAAAGAGALADDGQRRLVVAALGRGLGVTVSREEAEAAGAAWLESLGVAAREREAFLAASGLDRAEAARLFETLAIERRVLDRAAHLLPDGPSRADGLAFAARVSGRWGEAAPRPRRRDRHRR
jgi:hypothetical protein